jgi:hypothetical protein
MKRVSFWSLVVLVFFFGIAFTIQTLAIPSTTSAAGTGTSGSHTTAEHVQMSGFSIDEPISIVFSSLVLLGATTVLRRNRRSAQRPGTPGLQELDANPEPVSER